MAKPGQRKQEVIHITRGTKGTRPTPTLSSAITEVLTRDKHRRDQLKAMRDAPPCQVLPGDCLEVLPTIPNQSIDAIITDPPYELGFMGKEWDGRGVSFQPDTWRRVLATMKEGAYLLAFGSPRTYHRLACAIEDAGLEIKDCVMWLYGTGFPKGKSCLKPAWEPILLARAPGPQVLPLGVDECRIPCRPIRTIQGQSAAQQIGGMYHSPDKRNKAIFESHPSGRWPANVVHDGSEEVLDRFAEFGETQSIPSGRNTASRFFYTAKASTSERNGGLEGLVVQPNRVNAPRGSEVEKFSTSHHNHHPTVKPLSLMRWLVKLIAPPGSIILDPFAGSGTTGVAAILEGRRAILIEREPPFVSIIKKRIRDAETRSLQIDQPISERQP